ncbi:Cysteine-rich membrane protein 2 [Spironucleus salmonicida]|uniref:Cysteine-rich membrane protein 2 n=1 Tax=Spironucleus salmonicida TaxID=348837 RepID=V6LNX9_9EUKA|nr:Cysteine-rich membrane protein 2 [Spironucleus salmonicida]|eukprot:EST42439.1 Cysteine-rich membrane protein 2 [Spironucleus salmonicida]
MSNKCTSTDKTTCSNGFFCPAHVPEEETACTSCTGNTTEKCQCGTSVNCATCDSSDSSKCNTCTAGFAKSSSGVCDLCLNGYFYLNNTCAKCSSSCKTCMNIAETCTSCNDNFTMSVNQTCEANCFEDLPDGNACISQMVEVCGNTSQITSCKCQTAFNCFECDNEDTTKCKSCMKGFKFEDGLCTSCDDGYDSLGKFCFAYEENSSRNLSGGAVVGIVIAVMVVVGGVAGGVFWFMKKSKVNQEIEKQNFSRE